MAIEFITISCPQCGSKDLTFENDVIECHMCGTKTLVERTDEQFDEQDEEMISSVSSDEDACGKARIRMQDLPMAIPITVRSIRRAMMLRQIASTSSGGMYAAACAFVGGEYGIRSSGKALG